MAEKENPRDRLIALLSDPANTWEMRTRARGGVVFHRRDFSGKEHTHLLDDIAKIDAGLAIAWRTLMNESSPPLRRRLLEETLKLWRGERFSMASPLLSRGTSHITTVKRVISVDNDKRMVLMTADIADVTTVEGVAVVTTLRELTGYQPYALLETTFPGCIGKLAQAKQLDLTPAERAAYCFMYTGTGVSPEDLFLPDDLTGKR